MKKVKAVSGTLVGALKYSKIHVYVSLTNQEMVMEYKHINQMDRKGIISCSLASSAMPIVYEKIQKINKTIEICGFIYNFYFVYNKEL